MTGFLKKFLEINKKSTILTTRALNKETYIRKIKLQFYNNFTHLFLYSLLLNLESNEDFISFKFQIDLFSFTLGFRVKWALYNVFKELTLESFTFDHQTLSHKLTMMIEYNSSYNEIIGAL